MPGNPTKWQEFFLNVGCKCNSFVTILIPSMVMILSKFDFVLQCYSKETDLRNAPSPTSHHSSHVLPCRGPVGSTNQDFFFRFETNDLKRKNFSGFN